MFKINDTVVIYRSYVHEEDIPFSSYRDGDVCIILDIYEGGTESWSGRDVGESYKVLNERTGETIYLDTVWLKHYNELYDEPYVRKTESELKESRKKAFLEWIEAEKKELYEIELLGKNSCIRRCIEDIRELEQGYEDDKYTNKYFNSQMSKLIRGLNAWYEDMNETQINYRDELCKKYGYLL